VRRFVICCLVDLIHPPLDDIRVGFHQFHSRNERRRRHERLLVDDGLFEIALDGCEHRSVGDGAEHTDGVGTEEVVGGVHVFGEGGCHNNDTVAIGFQFLDDKVHESSQLFVFALKQLCHREEN